MLGLYIKQGIQRIQSRETRRAMRHAIARTSNVLLAGDGSTCDGTSNRGVDCLDRLELR